MFFIHEDYLKRWLQWMLGNELKVTVYCERDGNEESVKVKTKKMIEEIVDEICRGESGVIVENERKFFELIWDIMWEYIDNAVHYAVGCPDYEIEEVIGLRLKLVDVGRMYVEEVLEELLNEAVNEGVVEIVENVI